VTLKGDAIAQEFQMIVEQYVAQNYAEGGKLRAQSKTIPIRSL
jgi:(E)-4-hydroxy-3-methylbut-2-enyl-diphosphate synthase